MSQGLVQMPSSTRGSAVTLQQRAYELIKARIVNLDLKPGEYVTDAQLAGELAISRTPVREALRRLEQEGLLISQARHGWQVYTLSLQDIRDIFEVKKALEGMLARRAAACPDQGCRERLDEYMAQMRRAAQAEDAAAWYQAHKDLHELIWAMGNNERAVQVVQGMNDQWHRLRAGFQAVSQRIGRAMPEHEELVTAILDGRGEDAERLMCAHLQNLCQDLIYVFANIVLPYTVEGV